VRELMIYEAFKSRNSINEFPAHKQRPGIVNMLNNSIENTYHSFGQKKLVKWLGTETTGLPSQASL